MRRALAANGFTGTGNAQPWRCSGPAPIRTSYGSQIQDQRRDELCRGRARCISGRPSTESAKSSQLPCRRQRTGSDRGFHVQRRLSRKAWSRSVCPRTSRFWRCPRTSRSRASTRPTKRPIRQKDGTVTAVRVIEDRTPGPVCAPAVAADYKTFVGGRQEGSPRTASVSVTASRRSSYESRPRYLGGHAVE